MPVLQQWKLLGTSFIPEEGIVAQFFYPYLNQQLIFNYKETKE